MGSSTRPLLHRRLHHRVADPEDRVGSGSGEAGAARGGQGTGFAPKTNKQTNSQKKGPHPPPCPALPLFLLPSYRTTTTGPPTTTPRDERHRPPSFCYRKMGCPRTREDKSGARQRGADEPPPDAFAVEVPAGTTQIGERAFDDVVSFQAHLDQNWDDDGAHAGSDRCTRKGLCEVILPRAAG